MKRWMILAALLFMVIWAAPLKAEAAEPRNSVPDDYTGYALAEITNADGLQGMGLNGEFYPVSDDLDWTDAVEIWAQNTDKRVICEFEDGILVNYYPVQDMMYQYITVKPDQPQIIYENRKFNMDHFQVTVTIHNEFKEDEYSFVPQDLRRRLYINCSRVDVERGWGGLNFGKEGFWWFAEEIDQISLEVNRNISPGSSVERTFTVYFNDDYAPDKANTYVAVNCTAVFADSEVTQGGEVVIGNRDLQIQEAEKKKAQTAYGTALAAAKSSLGNAQTMVELGSELNYYLDNEQLTAVKAYVYAWVSDMFAAPSSEYAKASHTIKDKIYKKLGINSAVVTTFTQQAAATDVLVDTKMGARRIHFMLNAGQYAFDDGAPYAGFGKIEFAVYEMDSNKEEKKGVGIVTYTDMDTFCDNLTKVADSAIKTAYGSVWGNNADKIADYLTEGTIVEVLKDKGVLKGTFSDNVYNMMTSPSKRYIKAQMHCPVDINIYDNEGKLCGAVKDNQVDFTYEDMCVSVSGDEKYVYLPDDNFYFEFIGTGQGTMDYVLEECDENGNVIRTIQYEDISLQEGTTYKAAVPEAGSLRSSFYDPVASDGTVVAASSDTQEYVSLDQPITWSLTDNGTLVVYGNGMINLNQNWPYKDDVKQIVFMDGAVEVGEDCFEYFTNLESVEMNGCVTKIGYGSFYECDKLKEVTVTKGVTSVEGWAFAKCDELEEVVIEGDPSYLAGYSFSMNPKLKSVKMYGSVGRLKEDAIRQCPMLEEVILSEGLYVIENEALISNDSLKELNIPSHVYQMPTYRDRNNASAYSSLLRVNVSEENEHYSSIDGVLFNKDATKLIWYSSQREEEEYQVPATVTEIGDLAFSHSRYLKKVTVPEGTAAIGYGAFYYCDSLETVILPESLTELGEFVFERSKALKSIKIPQKVSVIPNELFYECEGLADVELPDGITVIGEESFRGCGKLKNIILPKETTEIQKLAFYRSGIEEIDIPAKVSVLDITAFENSSSLERFTVAEENASFSADEEGVLFDKEQKTLLLYPKGKKGAEYTVKETVASIGTGAFGDGSRSDSLKRLTILNPECVLEQDAVKGDDMTICGYRNSTAQAYAEENGNPFVPLEGGDEPDEPDNPGTMAFTDVGQGAWYYDSVQYVYANGLMTGLNDTTFGPGQTLARAQFAVILYRMNGEPPVEYTSKFEDVEEGLWYTDAILWASEQGVVTGYSNGNFGPGDLINREQMALMMYRYALIKGYDTGTRADISGYSDASWVSEFAVEAMQWAVGNGIITGKYNETMLEPQGSASRAECATIIMRFVETYEK